ncbi:MAG: flavin reductase family protein [Microthrixaceae bacterium]
MSDPPPGTDPPAADHGASGTGPADLGSFAEALDGPMIVVTTVSGGQRSGCLVGFHTQCSMDPPRYAVALSKRNHTYRVALGARVLGVSLLSESQVGIAELFGGHTEDEPFDKFDHCEWVEGPAGVPLVSGAAAWIAGEVVERVDVGDHVLFVVSPGLEEVARPRQRALRFTRIESIEPGHP